MDCSKEGKSGMTIVEVIIGLMIFTMVILGGLAGIGRGFELIDTTRNYTRSSQVLQSELELLRTMPWATFSTLTDAELTKAFQDQIVSQFNQSSYVGTVTTETTGGDLMKVTVTLEWDSRKGRTHTLNYVTYFTEGGVNDYYIN